MKKRALIYIVIAGLLWGSSGIFFNLLKPYGFSPLQMTSVRGVVSALAVLIYVLLFRRDLFRVKKSEIVLFFFSGICVFATAALYYAAIEQSSVSTAVILMYTAPVFVMAYSVAFLGEKLSRSKLFSVVMMLLGCALVSGIVGGMRFSFWGILLGLGSGLSYSAYNVLTKIEMIHHSSSLSATLYSFLTMGIVSLFFAQPAQLIETVKINPPLILTLMLGIGLCTCVTPYFLYTLALRDLPAGTASALGIIEPMSATVFSILFFGEQLSLASAVGILLVLGAVFLLNRSEAKEEK